MSLNTDRNRVAHLLIAGAVALHLVFIWLPQINLEWVFVAAARFFETNDASLLNRYLELQANTLGISYLSYLVGAIMPGVDVHYAPRLLAISGVLLLGAAILNFARMLQTAVHTAVHTPVQTAALVALVLFNPLIWTYSGRGTADFLPAAVALFSLSWLLDHGAGRARLAFACVLFGLAITLKYHAAFLLPLLWLDALSRGPLSRSLVTSTVAKTALICLLPACYLLLVKQTLGFWVTPPAFQTALEVKLSATFWLTNFVAYLGYLGLLLLPFSAFAFVRYLFSFGHLLGLIAVCAALFATGYTVLTPQGEMNFGPLDPYLDARFINGALCTLAGLLCLATIDTIRQAADNGDRRRRLLLVAVGCLVFIAILSVSRPAQRYLLFVLPLAYLLLPQTISVLRKPLLVATLFAYIAANAFVGIKQYATGTAAVEMVHMLEQQELLSVTDPGIILGHAGHLFPFEPQIAPRYTVVPGKRDSAMLFTEYEALPFIRQSYSVVEN